MEALGEDVGKLLIRRHPDQADVAVLDSLMREVLPDVDVFGALPSSDDVVRPLDAGGVVLVYGGIARRVETHVDQKIAEIDHLNCHL